MFNIYFVDLCSFWQRLRPNHRVLSLAQLLIRVFEKLNLCEEQTES